LHFRLYICIIYSADCLPDNFTRLPPRLLHRIACRQILKKQKSIVMKTNSVRNRLAIAFFSAAAALTILIANPIATFANGGEKKAHINDENLSVQYIGTDENNVVFHVDFQNAEARNFWLIIKNDEGDVVYKKEFSETTFSKTVYIQKEGLNDIHPTFVIRSGNDEVSRQFAINRILTEKTVVTRL
jgi:hypothetical protein